MKKFIYILMAIAGLVLCSCDPDQLETSPTTAVSGDTVLTDTDGGYMALNGTIRLFWQWGWTTTGNYHQCIGPQGYNLMADLMGEDMVQAAIGNGWFWYDYIYNVKTRYTTSTWRSYDMWNYYYTLICNVNYIIATQDTMEGATEDIEYIMGNAYAYRAYCEAYAAMIFARSYIGHEDRLSVPLYTDPTTSTTSGHARSTNEEVFEQAMSDIDTAIELLDGKTQQHCSHIDYYVANGIKARIALYMGDYSTAYSAAKLALSGGVSYDFDTDFRYNDADDDSVMWGAEIITSQGTTNPQFLAHMDWRFGGYGDYSRKCLSQWVVDQMDTNDARLDYDNGGWWRYEILYDGETYGWQQYKFLFADPDDPYTGADHIFMRGPEMMLIVAESACRLGYTSEAQEYLNELMSTRLSGYDCSSKTESGKAISGTTTLNTDTCTRSYSLLDEIIMQRRIELWGEYGRVYDIKRLRQGFTRTVDMGHTTAALLNSYNCDDPETFDWVLTIPQTELDANPLMVQNPIDSYATSTTGDDPALNATVASSSDDEETE